MDKDHARIEEKFAVLKAQTLRPPVDDWLRRCEPRNTLLLGQYMPTLEKLFERCKIAHYNSKWRQAWQDSFKVAEFVFKLKKEHHGWAQQQYTQETTRMIRHFLPRCIEIIEQCTIEIKLDLSRSIDPAYFCTASATSASATSASATSASASATATPTLTLTPTPTPTPTPTLTPTLTPSSSSTTNAFDVVDATVVDATVVDSNVPLSSLLAVPLIGATVVVPAHMDVKKQENVKQQTHHHQEPSMLPPPIPIKSLTPSAEPAGVTISVTELSRKVQKLECSNNQLKGQIVTLGKLGKQQQAQRKDAEESLLRQVQRLEISNRKFAAENLESAKAYEMLKTNSKKLLLRKYQAVQCLSQKLKVHQEKVLDFDELLKGSISFEFMKDPVVTPAGHLYDRTHINHWIHTNHNDPFTRKRLEKNHLHPVRSIKDLVDKYRQENDAKDVGTTR
jgi:hypothetical protein